MASMQQELARDRVQLNVDFEMKTFNAETELNQERQKIEQTQQQKYDSEVAKITEILEQEYEFKAGQLEARFNQKQKQMEDEFKDLKRANLEELSLEKQKLKVQEQHMKLQTHADATQEIYEDVRASL